MASKKIQSWEWYYSIRNRTIILLVGLSMLSLALFSSIRYTDRRVSENATAYRISQHNEVLAQKLATLVDKVYINNNESTKKNLQEVITNYDYNLNILKTGGEMQYAGHQLNVAASKHEQLAKLNDLMELWDIYRDNLYTISNQQDFVTLIDSTLSKGNITFNVKKVKNQTRLESYNYLKENNVNLSNLNEILSIFYFDKLFISKRNRSIQLAFFFLIFVTIFLMGYYHLVKNFSQPVEKVIKVLKQLANGKLDSRLEIQRKNEIGQIAQDVNILADDLKKASNFAHAIGNYDFEMDFSKKNEQDSLSIALLSMRDSLKRVDEESNRRRWTNEGVTLFNDILRTNFDEFDEFAYQIVYNLVKYININQGGFYSIQENAEGINLLNLNAAYAYDRRRFEAKSFSLEEGLLAQSIIEKDVIYLTEIPKGYIEITSGLGDAPPSVVLIIPLIVENEVFGAIELASFNELQEFEMEFAKRIAEMVASTIASVRVNERTKKLLDEATFVTKQMRTQEAEMKQNVEELETIQEALEMRDKEKEIALSEIKSKHVSQLEDIKSIERNLRKQKSELMETVDDSNEKIDQLEKQKDNLRIAIDKSKSKQQDLSKTIKDRDEVIKHLQQTIKVLKKEIKDFTTEEDVTKDNIEEDQKEDKNSKEKEDKNSKEKESKDTKEKDDKSKDKDK